MKPVLFRFLCVLLLLAGQQAALTHALSHAQDPIARSTVGERDGNGSPGPAKQGERYALCDFHYAYTQVLGGVHAVCMPAPQLDASFDAVAYASGARIVVSAPPFLIRGPPHTL